MNELHTACANGDLPKVIALLKTEDINKLHTKLGKSPLCFALEGSHWPVVAHLLKNGAEVLAVSSARQNEELKTLVTNFNLLSQYFFTLGDTEQRHKYILQTIIALRKFKNPPLGYKKMLLNCYQNYADYLKNKSQYAEAIKFLDEGIAFCNNESSLFLSEKLAFTVLQGLVRVESMRDKSLGNNSQRLIETMLWFEAGIKQFRKIKKPAEIDQTAYLTCLEFTMVFYTQNVRYQDSFKYMSEGLKVFTQASKLARIHVWMGYMYFCEPNYIKGLDSFRAAMEQFKQISDIKDEITVLIECNESASAYLNRNRQGSYEQRIVGLVASCLSNLATELSGNPEDQSCIGEFYILYSEITNSKQISNEHHRAYALLQKAMELIIELADGDIFLLNKTMRDFLRDDTTKDKEKIVELLKVNLRAAPMHVSSAAASFYGRMQNLTPEDQKLVFPSSVTSSLR